jgi:hypothetical protein
MGFLNQDYALKIEKGSFNRLPLQPGENDKIKMALTKPLNINHLQKNVSYHKSNCVNEC